MDHFTPWQAPRPCWHCSAFLGMLYSGSAAACARGGVRAMPAQGCAYWEREHGAGDMPRPSGTGDTIGRL